MSWKDKLKEMGEKAQDSFSAKADQTLEEHLPKIKELFEEKVGPRAMEMLADDEKMTTYSKVVYALLPGAVRVVVKEEGFVAFCFTHRSKLLAQGLALGTTVGEKPATDSAA